MAEPPLDRPLPPCPACGEERVSSLACLACGAIPPEPAGANHFQRLGLSAGHALDPDAAEAGYLRLSRLLHPDFQGGADEQTRQRALAHSALLNEAWRVLNDEQLRAEYLLELHDPGVLERHKKLSPAFLMEAMELSEELQEARASGCQDTVQRIARMAQAAISERMKGVSTACGSTIRRIARERHGAPREAPGVPARLLSPHEWNTEQIAILLHQARVYRRILRDTEASSP